MPEEKVKKNCPFMTIPVMTQNLITKRAEPSLQVGVCLGDKCEIFDEQRDTCGIKNLKLQ